MVNFYLPRKSNQDKPSRQIILKGLIIFQKLQDVGHQNHILFTGDWKTSIAPMLRFSPGVDWIN
jgi:hypothetical protein